ncbi:MAG: 3-isopropylmalate dehydratase large subunit, 3-isopropylmalate/(R)-2-methylmalate dehydratase large subunit [Candidatus Peregrinibacteria bacterium GW2011_GWF2_33_10]|nr:MAG: 3-isopropylmalate dehydratase large subunit, 3-isopropylmalate/(R)-2-methylmalate dehydratase large subunit [Candidatus Peregrinibacteria bacterium GW2011_GWF2_33_10]OGJ45626.1 MAG: 3-isopropylmalate dehydratase large subunit [Candidatus Peregrinibacteria bacterium RIFOXYA2_FULL_33_21]OGJ46577.1 MAG: 3-isopropylmalate dehydratase large subunit [Candidatus Peregrinibacteria bacterium RIFOXYA12_FULL_33_12]OGJ51217.1 MAG: 3-isopropylmalate dehydratase large subunit [Candidatus Peregrinibact
MSQTLFDKIWNAHVVHQEKDGPAIIYIDRQMLHEVTSPQAFTNLRKKNLQVRKPEKNTATFDHSSPTLPELYGKKGADSIATKQLNTLVENCQEFGITCYDWNTEKQGVVHVIAPELGLTQPGMTIVCGDSHTSTHGAFGALAFGIGTSEVEHVLATQCLLQFKPKTMLIKVNGEIQKGITAKDIILAIIREIGFDGGTGYVIEYTGSAIKNLSMEGRMTLCNMTIEAGARAGMIATDETTFEYLKNKEFAPKALEWEKSLKYWKTLKSDKNAKFDKTIEIDISDLEPMVTWGTNPSMGIKISGNIPYLKNFETENEKLATKKALEYMGLKEGQKMEGQKIDVVFIGSCTNGRIEDLRSASQIVKGHKKADHVRALVVPGSRQVEKQAIAEGLDKIFIQAGFEWRRPGCSMCLAMNGDMLEPGQYCASTSNRNFEGRQGPKGRTFLMSPIMAAAAGIEGRIVDVRKYL